MQAGVTKWTQADQTAIGSDYNYGIDQENVYEIGSTGLSIGASLAVQYQTFNKTGPYGNPADPDNFTPNIRSIQSLYQFTLSPYLDIKSLIKSTLELWSACGISSITAQPVRLTMFMTKFTNPSALASL